jgi:hypothetical protein
MGDPQAIALEAPQEAVPRGGKDPAIGYADNRKFTLTFRHLPTGKDVAFPAFLTDYSDAFTSNWNEEEVYGRNDPIMTFRNTRRVINLGWDIPAYSVQDAFKNLDQCTTLMKMQYPMYSDGDGASSISKAPLFRLKFVNLISKGGALGGVESGLLGTLKGCTFAPDIDAGFFDFQQNTNPGAIAPKVIKLSCEFTVLHEEDLGWNSNKEWRGDSEYFGYVPKDFDLESLITTPRPDGVPGDIAVDAAQEPTQQEEDEGEAVVNDALGYFGPDNA